MKLSPFYNNLQNTSEMAVSLVQSHHSTLQPSNSSSLATTNNGLLLSNAADDVMTPAAPPFGMFQHASSHVTSGVTSQLPAFEDVSDDDEEVPVTKRAKMDAPALFVT